MRFGMLITVAALLLLTTAAGAAPVATNTVDAPRTINPMPGDSVPDFTLTDVNGNSYTLSDYTSAGNIVVLEWFNPDCPAVGKYRTVSNFMNDTADAYANEPVVWLAIDSSGPGRASSDPRRINSFIRETDMTAPVLLDTAGDVGRDFGVMLTPTIVVVSPNQQLIYRGAPDASTVFNTRPAGTNYTKEAIDAALDNAIPLITMSNPHGCIVPYASLETY